MCPPGPWAQSKMEVIRAAVRDLGKGLLVVGGPHSFTMGDYRDTPLEDVLPVFSQVPEREETGRVALGLIIDNVRQYVRSRLGRHLQSGDG